MPKLVFYRHKRDDGGIRTGVELDDDRVADWFEPGPDDTDRALLWYIDLRCEGSGVPDEPEVVLDWLLEQGPIIRDGFSRFAEHLRYGFDPDIYTVRWTDFRNVSPDVSLLIACSAVRRVDAREMGSHLLEIALNWDAILQRLGAAQEVEDRPRYRKFKSRTNMDSNLLLIRVALPHDGYHGQRLARSVAAPPTVALVARDVRIAARGVLGRPGLLLAYLVLFPLAGVPVI